MTRVPSVRPHVPAGRGAMAAALALVTALSLAACGGEDTAGPPSINTLPTVSPSAVAQPVRVEGLPDGVDLEVSDGEAGVSPGGGLTFVSPVYDLGPSGDLGTTASVRIELDHALPAGSTVLAATREDEDSPWSWIPATLTSDLQHADFETDHFSEYGVLALDVGSVVATFKAAVRSGTTSSVDAKVAKPVCAGPKEARRLGFTVTSTPRKTLGWCFGLEKNKPVLKVVNRRPVPVQVAHGEAPATATASKAKGVWAAWLGVVGRGASSTFLAPGGSVIYDVDIASPSKLIVSTQADAVAQSLRALYAGVVAMTAQAQRYGIDSQPAATVFQGLLARPECASTLGKGADALLAGCLSEERTARLFGDNSALILQPIVSSAAIKRFWAARFAFLDEQDQSVDTQEIIVERRASDFGDLVGLFTGASRSATVAKSGQVVENFDTPSGRVIQLTYQLSRPQVSGKGTGRTTKADALLKKVTVYDRKAIDGNVPKAGSQGTISITDGVLTPPFLQTRYCDKPAAKKGTCD